MANKKTNDAARRLERYRAKAERQRYVLRLYVTGTTPASMHAIANLRALCEARLKDRYELEVIDIFQQPELAAGEQIIAAPTLVKKLPLPMRRFIGDLSGLEGKLFGLDLVPRRNTRQGGTYERKGTVAPDPGTPRAARRS